MVEIRSVGAVGAVLAAGFPFDHLRILRSLLDREHLLAGGGLYLFGDRPVPRPDSVLRVVDDFPEFLEAEFVDSVSERRRFGRATC